MFRAMTRAESAGGNFALVIAIAYVVVPIALHLGGVAHDHLLRLAGLSGVAAVSVVFGSRFPLFDGVEHGLPKAKLRFTFFAVIVWGMFLAFVIVACVTAERIPFIAALQGADADTVALLRERFLKAREGWQSSFAYINLMLVGALVPYTVAQLMLRNHRLRWVCFVLFLVYCMSFVEKVFFVKAMVPVAYLVLQRRIGSAVRSGLLLAGTLGLLVIMTLLSGAGAAHERGEDGYFSVKFVPQSPSEFLIWRATVIPVITAADVLKVFQDSYGGKLLRGATSSIIAVPFGLDRVTLERAVYAAQWGQNETETGSANSVYVTEAYVNFGVGGVVGSSLIVGLMLRLFARSRDEALRSLWMLFCFNLFIGPLTGTLFSNGFVLVTMISLMIRFTPGAAAVPFKRGQYR